MSIFKNSKEREVVQKTISQASRDTNVREIKLTGSIVDGKTAGERGDLDLLVIRDIQYPYYSYKAIPVGDNKEGIDVISVTQDFMREQYEGRPRSPDETKRRNLHSVVKDMNEKGITLYKRE
jgi:hypothetical protein